MAYMQYGSFLTLTDVAGNSDITVTTTCGASKTYHPENPKWIRVENNTADTFWTGGFTISSSLWGCPFNIIELQDTTADNSIPSTDWLNVVNIIHEDNYRSVSFGVVPMDISIHKEYKFIINVTSDSGSS